MHPPEAGAAEADMRWATRVLDAAAAAQGAAVTVDGKMVDRPVLLRAQATMDRAGQAVGGEAQGN